MICPHCQSENRDGAKFCNECGFPLTGLIAVSEAASNVHEATLKAADQEVDSSAYDDAEEHVDAALDESLPTIDVRGLNVDENGNPYSDDGDIAKPSFDDAPYVDEDDASDEYDGYVEESPTVGLDVSNADEFDFDPIPLDEEESEVYDRDLDEREGYEGDASATSVIPTVPPVVSSSDKTQALTPVSSNNDLWRGGGTMEMPRVEEDRSGFGGYRAPEGSPQDGPSGRKGKGKIIAIVVLVVVLAAAAAAFATYQMELWGGKVVPDVLGMTEADATSTLEEAGFTVRSMDASSDEPEGLVLLTDPANGNRAEKGSEVIIHVSVARVVPSVVGLPQQEALDALADAGYTRVSVVTEKSNETEESVIAVDPVEGTKATATAQVTLTVAEPYYVPDVSGQEASAAQAALEAEGYVVTVSRMYTEEYPENTAISTDPVAGTKLNTGESVTLFVAMSRASELVSVTYNTMLWAGADVTVNGVSYTVDSVDAVTYQGNDTVAYTFTGTPYTYFLGVRIELDPTSVSGTLTFNDDNTLAASSPTFSVNVS